LSTFIYEGTSFPDLGIYKFPLDPSASSWTQSCFT
jgi:hypothetical protein